MSTRIKHQFVKTILLVISVFWYWIKSLLCESIELIDIVQLR